MGGWVPVRAVIVEECMKVVGGCLRSRARVSVHVGGRVCVCVCVCAHARTHARAHALQHPPASPPTPPPPPPHPRACRPAALAPRCLR